MRKCKNVAVVLETVSCFTAIFQVRYIILPQLIT